MSAFSGKTLMITGGTGSFGNTVLKHFLMTDIGEIRIFSRDEKKQDDMRHEIQAKYALLNKIESEYPWVNVVGSEPSVFRKMTKKEEEELANRINATKPDFVWVALGAPRQEEFCYRNEGKINGLMVGVGGAFNVISGVIDEAPRWMQNISMEWFYRFVKEPRRLFKRWKIQGLALKYVQSEKK